LTELLVVLNDVAVFTTPTGGLAMRKLTSTLVAAVALVALPHLALAQRARSASSGPKNEIGVDLGAAYSHTGSGCNTDCGGLGIGTPIDVRWGFMSKGPLSFEPRFSLNYLSGPNAGGGHVLVFNPDLNVIYRMKRSTPRRGMYLTGGLGLAIANSAPSGGSSTTATQLSLNGGVGKRIPMESNAWRVEGFLRYNFENNGKGVPSSFDIGARLGMSFWR
jgi:hypothetical protein